MIWVIVKAGFGAPFCPNGNSSHDAATGRWLWLEPNLLLLDLFILFKHKIGNNAQICFLISLLFLWSEYFEMHCGSHLAQRWTPDWGPADESPCWTVQSARQWRMRPGGPVRCTPGLLRRELQALVHRKDGTFMLAIQQFFKKKNKKQIMTKALSGYFCLRWALPVRARWCWRPTVSRSRQRSRRGGAGVRCCTLSPRPSQCVRTTLLAASMGLHEAEKKSAAMILLQRSPHSDKKGGRSFTVGVVRVDVGIGGVPALYGSVYTSTETLLPRAAHHHAQYGPPVVQIRFNKPTSCHSGFFFFALF